MCKGPDVGGGTQTGREEGSQVGKGLTGTAPRLVGLRGLLKCGPKRECSFWGKESPQLLPRFSEFQRLRTTTLSSPNEKNEIHREKDVS